MSTQNGIIYENADTETRKKHFNIQVTKLPQRKIPLNTWHRARWVFPTQKRLNQLAETFRKSAPPASRWSINQLTLQTERNSWNFQKFLLIQTRYLQKFSKYKRTAEHCIERVASWSCNYNSAPTFGRVFRRATPWVKYLLGTYSKLVHKL